MWLRDFALGIFWAWLAVWLYKKLCLWWDEAKGDFKMEVVEHDHPQIKWWKE